ncbi:uncharacterized protein EAE98_009409 [Botrytis deweyae]|uniref:Myb-like domain-containing protein n=1 Tax=Botrytis deweyae TaxID=2478750 RepID=A0ABQ7IBB5_9HELO|nr:uncharacterized protein EAE98_009409 [Botrytis deweyae]KAF7919089.1 hypothetical protein EAE98_009409 [Botrytis deweyae]
MSGNYRRWTDLEKDYLRRHGPKSGDNVAPEIWVKLTDDLNDRIKEWCRKNPYLVTIPGKPKDSKPREPWTRTLVAIQGYYTTDGFSELYPEKGPAARPKNLVKPVSRYTKDTELSKYPPELDFQLKKMIDDNPDWKAILKKCKELGGEGNEYTHGSVRNRHTKFLKDVSLEVLQNRAEKVAKQQNASDCLLSQPSDGGSSSTKQEVGRALRTTETGGSDTSRSIRTDERDNRKEGESSRNRQSLPMPRSSARSPSGSRQEGKRPVRATELQDRKTNQPLAPAGGSGNDQEKPVAKTGAKSTREGSQRNSQENRMPQKASVKRDKYRERKDPAIKELEEGEILEIKRTDTGRSNSPDKQHNRDSRLEKKAKERREKELKNPFGRR